MCRTTGARSKRYHYEVSVAADADGGARWTTTKLRSADDFAAITGLARCTLFRLLNGDGSDQLRARVRVARINEPVPPSPCPRIQ